MKKIDGEPLHELREKTDKSLEVERIKTDSALNQKTKKLENDTSVNIDASRVAADENRESKRTNTDLATEERLKADNNPAIKSVERILTQERERSDKALDLERKEEDRLRDIERFRKRMIAESLLESERKETDTNLQDERTRIDLDAKQRTTVLSDEKESHHLTKVALVSRDQFLAVVSHDLRNLITSISLNANLMRRGLQHGGSDIEGLSKNVNMIERSAATMDRMIGDLLDVERMANEKLTINPTSQDICALLNECKELFAPVMAEKSVVMTVDACAKPVFASVDHDRILQVLSNLIGNALKFSPKGSSIQLTLEKRPSEVKVSVADNGPGIPENRRAEIFERFSQLQSNDRRGRGLGLGPWAFYF